MTFEDARRLTEVLMAVAFVQQGVEHLAGPPRDRPWFVLQVALALLLAAGVEPAVLGGLLLLVTLALLRRFGGPYNGGSDRMRLLVLTCVWASRLAPGVTLPRIALGYLAVQVVLSYTIAGWVKLANADWRTGRALADVFAFSAYPVSGQWRACAGWPRVMLVLSWATLMFELLFPIALVSAPALAAALAAAFLFHLVNAAAFGLNRFVWIWVATYPALLWFQQEFLAPILPW
ncbi:MAG: HTTM domain-containing protein [Vicinamibacterales bacterium]